MMIEYIVYKVVMLIIWRWLFLWWNVDVWMYWFDDVLVFLYYM